MITQTLQIYIASLLNNAKVHGVLHT